MKHTGATLTLQHHLLYIHISGGVKRLSKDYSSKISRSIFGLATS